VGRLLLQTTPTGTTVYFQNEQATYSTANGAVTGIRYLALPGGGTAVRTGNNSDYTFEITDQHDTADLDYTCQTPTWRQFDPYGNARGTTATWVDNRTFLDKVTDPDTSLTDVGARWYDATLGKFISLDPVFESGDTLALGGYGYTDGNPVTQQDPSGEMIADPNGGGGSEQALEAQQAAAEKREAADDLARIEQDSDNMSSDSDAADDDLAYSEAFAKLPYGGEGGKALQYLQDSLDLQHQYLASANDARDEIVDLVNTQRALGVADGGIGSRQASLVSTVTAAWDPKTGKIYVGWSLNRTAKEYGKDFCGEDDCEAQAVADGVEPRTIQFTITIRPRGLLAKAICIACQEDYDPI
jgi:RHS repeat-associated protein